MSTVHNLFFSALIYCKVLTDVWLYLAADMIWLHDSINDLTKLGVSLHAPVVTKWALFLGV